MIKFGPSGNSTKFYDDGNKVTEQAGLWLKNMGLDLFEYSFGRGANLSDEKCLIINEAMKKNDIEISVHAPYYINLANTETEMIEKSYGYLLTSLEKGRLMGAKRVIFHVGGQGKLSREKAFEYIKNRMQSFCDIMEEKGFADMLIAPETMGKMKQIGTVEEIIELSKMSKMVVPCIDFGHLNARTQGGLKTENDYEEIILALLDGLGEKAKKIHIHFSKIQYSKGGEVKHLTFEDNIYGPEFEPLANILYKHSISAKVICESAGTQGIDALEMRNIYNRISREEI